MIHFIGLGNMGLPMAKNLAATHELAVFDLGGAQCSLAAAAGLQLLQADAVGVDARVVITALPAGVHMRAAIIDQDIGSRTQPACLFIDCTTADYASAMALHQYAASRGHLAIDAPMSGGSKGAEAGTLTFMLGGEDQAIQQAQPYLQAMGANILHAGKAGAGQVAKICNNMMLAISMAGTCEALNLGVALGLDPAVLAQIMHKSSGNNWVLEKYNPWPGVMEQAPASNGYQGGFKSSLMLKDLGLAESTAIDHNLPVHLGGLARSLYAQHCIEAADLDFSSILQHYTGKQ